MLARLLSPVAPLTTRSLSAAAATTITAPPFVTASGAENVGILGMEFYVPQRYVAMDDLEAFDGVSKGKYTIGLGQQSMAFADDVEDSTSLCLNAVANLLAKYDIPASMVGRLEVGTESIVDKSKSTKTTLMSLLDGFTDCEGATCVNACYGGTAALLNTVAWTESSEWDGRYGIVVAADVAVYDAGPARPTGGAGAVAFLVGPDAPLAFVPRTRATHASDVYDFYKPSMMSEYPMVDGRLSQVCYLRAVDDCYRRNMSKMEALTAGTTEPLPSGLLTVGDAYDHMVFHSPYNKLVQQSFNRIVYNDFRRILDAGLPVPPHMEALAGFADMTPDDSYFSKDLDKALRSISTDAFKTMVEPSCQFSQLIGNTYTASVFNNLACLVSNKRDALVDSRVGVFSYGSGAIATLYALAGRRTDNNHFSLERMADVLDGPARLAARRQAPAAEFVEALSMRERSYGKANLTPEGSLSNLAPGTFYLAGVDGNYTRSYARA